LGAKEPMVDFKDIPWKDVVVDTDEFTIFKDGVPVTEGHELIVPKKNTHRVIAICLQTAHTRGLDVVRRTSATGYNIGMNNGESAGQTVMWPHVHLIPRYDGDMEDPRGGVRHVIPDRGNYKTSEHYKDVILD